MKKTLNNKRSLVARLAVVGMLLALVAVLFAGCMGRTAATAAELEVGEIAWTEGENGLSKVALEKIADLLAKTPEAREAFVAAGRGYDMTEEGFDMEADRPVKEASVSAAINVLKKFDKDNTLKDIALEGKAAEGDTPAVAGLNEKDVASLVDALKQTIDIEGSRGFWDNIHYGIGVVLAWITKYLGFGNYLVGICIFAVLVEIVMLPFGIRQQQNSIKQAKLRPKEMAIRKKYAGRNDQATQQKIAQEIQELYQKEGYSPFGGCLPLLIQFPVLIVLYNIVVDPVRYILGFTAESSSALATFCTTAKAAGGLGHKITSGRGSIEALSFIGDKFEGLKDFAFFANSGELSAAMESADSLSFSLGPINLGLTPSWNNFSAEYLPLLAVPVLTFVVYFFSMKLSRKFTYQPTTAQDAQTGCSNSMMDITMPLMSVYIAFIVPAVVGVYWIFKSLLNTLKQFILSRVMPIPTFTEEDYKAAEKEMKGKGTRPASNRPASSNGQKPRSLHYIDKDDEPTPAPAPKKKAEPKAEESEKKEEVKKEEPKKEEKSSPIEKLPLKDDSKTETPSDDKTDK